MIFENGKEITRICENGKDIIARYCEGHLLWSSGIKLKSLLGKQNTEQSITLSSPLNLNTAVGFGMSGNGITYPNNLWGGSYGKPIEIKETHYYLYAIKVNKNVLSTANTWGGFYFATQGGYIDNQTMAYTDGEWYLGIQKANKSLINDNFFGIFARSLALNTGDIITCYKSFILDLTQAKLDTLTAEQVYNLITLNGTDFTNLELLSAGYEIKLGSFKSQETNSVDLGDFNYYYNSGKQRFNITTQFLDMVSITNTARVGEVSINGYETSSLDGTETGDLKVATYNNYIYITNHQYTNATDFKNAMKGVKLTYKLANTNNIAQSKYGFVKVKDIPTWTYETSIWGGTFRATSLNSIGFYSKGSYSEKDNLFINGLQNMSRATLSTSTNGISAQPQIIFIKDSSCLSVDDLLAKYGEEYIVFELEHSFGNKLDNYTAEQVYYMFFATLGMSKMYVPYGKRFESSDNIILGTKYGIVDMSKIYYSYQSGNNRFYSSGIQNIVKYTQGDTASVPNIYIDGLEAISLNTMGSGTTHDYSITIYNGLIFVRVLQYTQPNDLINFFKGKYLIFPLATPNSTDYNDLSAKEMYDVINDNVVDILANGKSIGGVRSIVGKQVNLLEDKTFSDYGVRITPTINFANGYFGYAGENYHKFAKMQIISGHEYLFCCHINNLVARDERWGAMYFRSETDNLSNILYSLQWHWEKDYVCGKLTGTNTGDLAFVFFGDLNSPKIDIDIEKPQSYIIVDLTEHNLQNLTAQEAYQYFKENNLNILDNRGEIDIGGYIKS